jgi:hypothetical protein
MGASFIINGTNLKETIMSHNINVLMYFGAVNFFNAVAEIGHTFVPNTAYCTRLIASRLNLEFSFGGEMKLIADGSQLLQEVVRHSKDGKFTKEDAQFAASQLSRIGLIYNSYRTVYHVQAYKEQSEKKDDVIVDNDSPIVVDVNTEIEKTSEDIISEEVLTSDDNVANIAPVEADKATAKRGRKSTK